MTTDTVEAAARSAATVRPMRWWDIGVVLPLERELFPVDPWSAAGFWSELAGVPDTRTYLVVELDGDVVGYAGLFVTGPDADVQTIAVRADLQGRGLGRLLLDELVAEARRRGATRLMLEVRAENDRALRLYEAYGFERLGLRPAYYGPGRDGVVMRRRLT